MANVLGELFQDIADSIRAKTGDTATMKPAEFPDKIAAIETGGGEVDERVKYVTFRNVANTELIGMRSYTFTSASTDGVLTAYIRGDEGYFNVQSLVKMLNRSNISIILDGVVHFLTTTIVSDSSAYFGNLALDSAGADTGESFLMSVGVDSDNLVRFFIKENATSASHNIGVYEYVTEMITYPVVSGDTVHDPVTKGYVGKPTKESTDQYNYTYGGWSLTPNGSVNSSALSNVTEDRVVYAAFTSSVRYYTITYYDSDGTTVLKTESLAYGSTPAYMPEKGGASFDGWTTPLATVTGDASYQAKWKEKITFAGGSWADIAAISESGKAAENFAIGDSRVVPLMYNGTTYNVTVKIVGFNHDDLADGSGKAGMSILVFTPLTALKCSANYVDARAQSGFNGLPDELKAVVKSVIKQEHKVSSSGCNTIDVTRTYFIQSLREGNNTDGNYPIGETYEMFDKNANANAFVFGNYSTNSPSILKDETGTRVEDFWARDKWVPDRRYMVYNNGSRAMYYSDSTDHVYSVVFGFCI